MNKSQIKDILMIITIIILIVFGGSIIEHYNPNPAFKSPLKTNNCITFYQNIVPVEELKPQNYTVQILPQNYTSIWCSK